MKDALGHREDQSLDAPDGSPDLVISSHTDASDFERLRREWDALHKQGTEQDPFLTCDWFSAWWRAFAGQRTLYLVVARQQGLLCAVLPMMLERTWRHGVPLRRLAALANDHTPHFDLIRSCDNEQLHRAIWNHFMTLKEQWDLLDFPCLSADSTTSDRFARLADEHSVQHKFWMQAPQSPWIILESSWKRYVESRSAGFRKSLRRKMRRLGDLGEVRLETVTSGDKLEQGLTDGMRIEAEGWKGANHTAILSQPAVTAFYTELATTMAGRGQLRLHFLTLDDVRIAFDYSIVANQFLYSLKAGHSHTHARYSPGTVMLALIVERAHEQGLAGVDLLGDADEFKMHWTDTTRTHQWLHCYSNSLRGRLLHAIKGRFPPAVAGQRSAGLPS